MITKIDIENFKSIKDLTLEPRRLNLFMGVNGMGKSTAIQALLLLRQSWMSSQLAKLNLNGELVEIGRGSDALYNFADNEQISFGVRNNDAESGADEYLERTYSYQRYNDVLDLKDRKYEGNVHDWPLFDDEFVFLNAERLAPATAYAMSYDKVVNNHSIGIHGELAAHFLSLYGDKLDVAKELCLDAAPTGRLMDQVVEWMKVISPGVYMRIQEIGEIDKVVLSYQFATDTIPTNAFRPTNVGFGISYILPVLVACLCGLYKLIIIENPEAHLHPKGQARMGELLARCARSGVQLFVETHSDHIVNGIRVAVKNGVVDARDVRINYFTKRIEDGETFTENEEIKIGANGELSSYPADFMDEWENQLMNLI